MYKGFNVSVCDNFFQEYDYYKKGKNIYEIQKNRVDSDFTNILNKNVIDGDTLQKMYFPDELFEGQNFVFISHSHKDENLALKLAGYLSEKFRISSFIDSCVWAYMEDLNKDLNGCTKKEYGYCNRCNCHDFSYNLSYVHMMLASALMKVIDQCECLFFLNTPSSININEKTESPWLYYELNIANIIRKTSEVEKLTENISEYMHSIEFTPNLENMHNINEEILMKWEQKYDAYYDDPYKVLYSICGGDTF